MVRPTPLLPPGPDGESAIPAAEVQTFNFRDDELWLAWSEACCGDPQILRDLGLQYEYGVSKTRYLGTARIGGWGRNRWVPKADGFWAVIMMVCSRDSQMMDLLAFRPETPKTVWTLRGHGWLLGWEFLARAEHLDIPLIVEESPLDLLRNRDPGVVILDWSQNWSEWFSQIPAIRCRSVEFGRRVQDNLQRPFRIPPVEVAI